MKRALLIFAMTCFMAVKLQGDPGEAVEQIPDGLVGDHGSPPVRIDPTESIITKQTFRPPIEITIVAKTDSKNLRIAYTASDVIFNWEQDETELRVDGGPADGKHQENKGHILPNKYVTIKWVVSNTEESIYVDGDLRFHNSADYSQINNPVSVFSHGPAILKVLSLTTKQL